MFGGFSRHVGRQPDGRFMLTLIPMTVIAVSLIVMTIMVNVANSNAEAMEDQQQTATAAYRQTQRAIVATQAPTLRAQRTATSQARITPTPDD